MKLLNWIKKNKLKTFTIICAVIFISTALYNLYGGLFVTNELHGPSDLTIMFQMILALMIPICALVIMISVINWLSTRVKGS